MEERKSVSKILLIAEDEQGVSRCISLAGMTVELVIHAPKADGGTADLKRLLAEACEGLEFYADPNSYARQGRNRSKAQEDKGDVARDTLAAIREEPNDKSN